MNFEVGKSYKTRGGWKATIKKDNRGVVPFFVCHENPSRQMWHMPDGKINLSGEKDRKYDLISEWEEPVEYKRWKDMTLEEKGALLLAHHEGKAIEFFGPEGSWELDIDFCPKGASAYLKYRVKPEPEVEVLEIYIGFNNKALDRWSTDRINLGKYKITFNLVDGEPDWSSLKGETL